jgi:hypothetical protein
MRGMNVPKARFPKENHKIAINIEDTEDRIGSRTIKFEVR